VQPFTTRDYVSLWEQEGRTFLRHTGREAHVLKILGELVHLGSLQSTVGQLALAQGLRAQVLLQAKPDSRRGHRLTLRYPADAVSAGAVEELLAAYNAAVRPFEKADSCQATDGPLINAMGKASVIVKDA
jgi:hypothetical protein